MEEQQSWGEREFSGCAVEDKREAKSLSAMADKLLANPELSFSGAVGGALRKAAWRIFSKEEVDIGSGHYGQTTKRCEDHELVFVSQDTTDISYLSHSASNGLGDLGGGRGGVNLGLCLHSAMAISEDGLPLGLVGQKIWAPNANGREQRHRKYPLEEKENYCWVEALQWSGHYLAKVKQVIMISDRESDFYEYMIAPRAQNIALLFRAHHLQRYVYYDAEKMPLKDVCFNCNAATSFFLPKAGKRKGRLVNLCLSWGKIVCKPPEDKKGPALTLWVVKAKETLPPAGEQALEWVLLTTIPIEDQQAALLMTDYYRKRWMIERWHLVLKQGMQIERLQFDCFTRLSNAIQLHAIVAWQLFCLKHLAAQNPDVDAIDVLEPLQVEVIQQQKGVKQLSLKQALIAIAALAGFVPSKKQPLPGEKTIWRGWCILERICQGYNLALQKNYGTG